MLSGLDAMTRLGDVVDLGIYSRASISSPTGRTKTTTKATKGDGVYSQTSGFLMWRGVIGVIRFGRAVLGLVLNRVLGSVSSVHYMQPMEVGPSRFGQI
jgi:hypothetical protein